MTEKNNRPLPPRRRVEGVAPDPLEVAARALEGVQPSGESWFTSSNPHAAPGQAPAPRYTPYQPQPQAGRIPGSDGLPQRTPGASRAPQAGARPDPRFFQPARPVPQRPMPSRAQAPQRAYQPNAYAVQQPRLRPAQPPRYANPAMPSYAAAQAPTQHSSFIDQGPAAEDRGRSKKAVLLPLAAMAIASAAIGAFAQANVDPGTGFESHTQQVKAHATQYDSAPTIEYVGGQEVVGAPDVIAPDQDSPTAQASPAVQRATAGGGKHSTGDYDAPSSAGTYGGTHSSSGSVDSPSGGGGTTSDPAPEPAPQPDPTPEPTPDPQPEPEQDEPTLSDNVVEPTLDATGGVLGTLTGIDVDLTP